LQKIQERKVLFMAKYQRFDEVPAWQEAARLYQRVLDLLEEGNLPLSANFRNQLDRAALSVLNNIAAGFERRVGSEVLPLLSMARNSAADVQSMMAVVVERPKLARYGESLRAIRALGESCERQLGAWMAAFTNGPSQGRQASSGEDRPAGAPGGKVGTNR
jgi:four helix bundle protein